MRKRTLWTSIGIGLAVVVIAAGSRDNAGRKDELKPTVAPSATVVEVTVQVIALTAVPTPPFTAEYGLAMQVTAFTVYAQGEVRLRSCPSRSCAELGVLLDGEALVVDRIINGEVVSAGNAIWYGAFRNGAVVYVYSEIVTDVPPGAPISLPAPPTAGSPYTCNGLDDLDCSDFSGGGATAHLAQCGDEDRLDADRDGQACEMN